MSFEQPAHDCFEACETGRDIASDYAHFMMFADGRISHMTKVRNDVQALCQLGWS